MKIEKLKNSQYVWYDHPDFNGEKVKLKMWNNPYLNPDGIWEIDGEKYILYKAIGKEDSVVGEKLEFVNKHICDCEKNYGKDCLYPEKYESEGCK